MSVIVIGHSFFTNIFTLNRFLFDIPTTYFVKVNFVLILKPQTCNYVPNCCRGLLWISDCLGHNLVKSQQLKTRVNLIFHY